MSIVATLTALLKLDTKNFSSGVNGAIASAQKLNRRLTFVSRDLQTAGGNLTALTLPLAMFGVASVKAVARAQEHANKIKVIFSDMQKEAGQSIKQFAKDFDLAESTAIKLVGASADLLTGHKFNQKEALKLAVAVNRLAGDLTSFNADVHSVADASARLTKGLQGQTRGLWGLRIAIRQDSAEFKRLVKDIQIQRGVNIQAAKALAIFQQATEQSKNAIGDFRRTADSFINVLRRIGQRVIEVKEEFGKLLIEGLGLGKMLIKVMDGLKKTAKFIKSLSPNVKKLLAHFLLGITVLGPLLLIVGSIGLAFTGIIGAVLALAKAFLFLFTPVGLVVSAIVGLGVALVKVFNVDLKKVAVKTLGFLLNIRANFQILSEYLKVLFKRVWENLPEIVKTVWDNILKNSKIAGKKIAVILNTTFRWLGENWESVIDNMLAALMRFIRAGVKLFMKLGKLWSDLQKMSFTKVKEAWKGFTGVGNVRARPRLRKTLGESLAVALGGTDEFVGLADGLDNLKLLPKFPGFITSFTNAIAELDKTIEDGTGKPGEELKIAEAIRGTVAELTKGSVEAFRIRANAQLKPAEETAKNTAETNDKLDNMIDVGVPIKNLQIADFSGYA